MTDAAPSLPGLPRIVIVGGGFGGIAAARALARADADVVLIDRHNHHLFQPLLYQVATAALSPADIAWPIRRLLRRQKNARVIMDEVTGISRQDKQVQLRSGTLHYHTLVLATGSVDTYFGHDDWRKVAPGLKTIDDAEAIRHRILLAFEQAELTADEARRRALLTFVVIGGGPTGVEMAGSIVELARKALAADFRHVRPETARIVLVEAGPRLLSAFTPRLTDYAASALKKLGVELHLGAAVTACDKRGVNLADERIDAATIIWAAGVAASPAGHWLNAPQDKAGRVIVDGSLRIEGDDTLFAVGDTVSCTGDDGKPLPGVAPVAKQQGDYVGKFIAARLAGAPAPKPFKYKDAGKLATIGRRAAVAELPHVTLKGRAAWWFWGLIHIFFLINLRSRLSVAIHWLWSYVTFDRGARLITGKGRHR